MTTESGQGLPHRIAKSLLSLIPSSRPLVMRSARGS